MAKRFGGKFSPDGQSPDTTGPARPAYHDKSRTRAGGRVNLLFIAPLPLVVSGFFGDPVKLATHLVAFALLILAAWLTREGILAQESYDARKIARRPAIPRKIFGAVVTGAGLFVAGYAPGGSLLNPMIFAGLGAVLHIASFGPDPLSDKGAEGLDAFQSDRVARAVAEAEKYLAAMSDAILRAEDRSLEKRVAQFQITARDMFRTVEQDPRDLTAARKYLGVYLMGARDATVRFVDIYARTREPATRDDYKALLDDLENHFAAQTEALLADNRTDLDIEIEVLRERLAREGVRTD